MLQASMEQDLAHLPLTQDRVLILDFGSQVTQLIARRVRESGVYCEIWPYDATAGRIAAFAPRAIILSGGPASVVDVGSPRVVPEVFSAGLPVLGICYGQQLMCEQLGGAVEKSDLHEFGRAVVEIVGDCALFTDSASLGPNIISDGHHQRFSASCAIARCSGVPLHSWIIRS